MPSPVVLWETLFWRGERRAGNGWARVRDLNQGMLLASDSSAIVITGGGGGGGVGRSCDCDALNGDQPVAGIDFSGGVGVSCWPPLVVSFVVRLQVTNVETLVSTAAYAAVLVVFVGTSVGGGTRGVEILRKQELKLYQTLNSMH